jgi:hypothetical protein
MTKQELDRLVKAASRSFQRENPTISQVPHPKPERHKKAALGETVSGKKDCLECPEVRFIGYRIRPCDPDNFSAGCKDLLDGLRHAGLILGDEPWKIRFVTEQVKVRSRSEERTEIEITYG